MGPQLASLPLLAKRNNNLQKRSAVFFCRFHVELLCRTVADMATQDEYGNYEPNMHDPMIGQTPSSKHGSGSPEGVISACDGDTYVDDDTGDFYVKTGGCNSTGWVLVTGGSGGHVSSYFGTDADPNGIVTATRPASYYDGAGNWWNKVNTGSNNTGWQQMIAAP